MPDREIITVGYDSSRCADRALEWAAREAEQRDAGVLVLACYSLPIVAEPWYVPMTVHIGDIEEDAQRHVDDVAKRIGASHPGVSFETRVELAPAAEGLIDAGGTSVLVVVGTHGRGASDAWRLGSVSHAVARRAPCPVVIVPDVEPGPRRDRVLVGVDGSPASHAALRWACDEADLREAELVVAHVWDYPYAVEGATSVRDLVEVDAALQLEEAVRVAREWRNGPVKDVLRCGRAAVELSALAEDADLLVVGTRGRNPVRTLLFGSVAQAVSARSTCPVVVVRDGERAAEK